MEKECVGIWSVVGVWEEAEEKNNKMNLCKQTPLKSAIDI